MSDIRISILVPVYNVGLYIAHCAETLLSQSLSAGVEYVFVDDGSTDNSIAILESVVKRHPEAEVRIVAHNENRGLATARKTAILAARGKYVTHVDSDDYVSLDYLATLYAAEASGADIVSGGYVAHHADGTTSEFTPRPATDEEDAGLVALKNEDWRIWGRLIKRNLYTQHPDTICPGDISDGEDLYSTPRLMHYAARVAIIPTHTYHYRTSNEHSITNTRSDRRADDLTKVWASLRDFFTSAYPDGRHAAAIGIFIADQKANLVLNHQLSMDAIRRHADSLQKETAPYAAALTPGRRTMLRLLHAHAWPLVWLLTLCAKIRRATRHQR